MNRLKKLSIGLLSIFILSCNVQSAIHIAGVESKTGTSEDKVIDGKALETEFYGVHSITNDNDGNVYISEQNGQVIRKLTRDGKIVTIKNSLDLSMPKDKNRGNASKFSNIKYKDGYIYYSHFNELYRMSLNGEIEKVFPLIENKDKLSKLELLLGKDGSFSESYISEQIIDFYFDKKNNIILMTGKNLGGYLKHLDMKNKVIRNINIIEDKNDIKRIFYKDALNRSYTSMTNVFSIHFSLNPKNNTLYLYKYQDFFNMVDKRYSFEPENPIEAIRRFFEEVSSIIENNSRRTSQSSRYEIYPANDLLIEGEKYTYQYNIKKPAIEFEHPFVFDDDGNLYLFYVDQNKIEKISPENKVLETYFSNLKNSGFYKAFTIDNKNKILYFSIYNKIFKVNIK